MAVRSRIFYAIYPGDGNVQQALNVIRYLCDPLKQHRAHITVRGPYERRLSSSFVKTLSKRVHGQPLCLEGVDGFFSDRQNTVFIPCTSPVLRGVWKKDHYAFIPHLTLYDGMSKTFAEALRRRLQAIPLRIQLIMNDIRPLVSIPKSDWNLRVEIQNSFIEKTLGLSVDLNKIANQNQRYRLDCIEMIWIFLQENAPPCYDLFASGDGAVGYPMIQSSEEVPGT